MAEPTGLEPATSDVTGRRSNQLNYDSALKADVRSEMVDVSDSSHPTPDIQPLHLVGAEGLEPPTSSL
jgi:hypothetical protein